MLLAEEGKRARNQALVGLIGGKRTARMLKMRKVAYVGKHLSRGARTRSKMYRGFIMGTANYEAGVPICGRTPYC